MTRVFAFVGSRLLLRPTEEGFRLPTLDEARAAFGADRLEAARVEVSVSRVLATTATFAFTEDEPVAEDLRAKSLRAVYHALDEGDFRAAGTAKQKIEWMHTHRFCSRCGAPTVRDERHEAMRCPECGQLHFPRVAPAVIVLVQRGREALLGRSARFPPGVYSTLAGFVEPGESLEECVHREVFEEVGVRLGALRYFSSQPHPYPHSLMVGFVADWVEGEIRLEDDEIEDARWFTPESLPELPHPASIARALIDDFARRVG